MSGVLHSKWWSDYNLYDKKTSTSALSKKCFAEFLGTCFLIFFGSAIGASLSHSLHVLQNAHFHDATDTFVIPYGGMPDSDLYGTEPINILFIATGFACALFIAGSVAGSISGGHVNPAVTFASFLTKKVSLLTGIFYIASQLLGGSLGCWLISIVNEPGFMAAKGSINSINRTSQINKGCVLVLEAALQFCLALTSLVMNTKYPNSPRNQMRAPTGTSMVLFIGHLIAVPVDGYAGNPVRAFAPSLVTRHWADQWIFWIGPMLGAFLAALTYLLGFASPKNANKPLLPLTSSDVTSPKRETGSEHILESIVIQKHDSMSEDDSKSHEIRENASKEDLYQTRSKDSENHKRSDKFLSKSESDGRSSSPRSPNSSGRQSSSPKKPNASRATSYASFTSQVDSDIAMVQNWLFEGRDKEKEAQIQAATEKLNRKYAELKEKERSSSEKSVSSNSDQRSQEAQVKLESDDYRRKAKNAHTFDSQNYGRPASQTLPKVVPKLSLTEKSVHKDQLLYDQSVKSPSMRQNLHRPSRFLEDKKSGNISPKRNAIESREKSRRQSSINLMPPMSFASQADRSKIQNSPALNQTQPNRNLLPASPEMSQDKFGGKSLMMGPRKRSNTSEIQPADTPRTERRKLAEARQNRRYESEEPGEREKDRMRFSKEVLSAMYFLPHDKEHPKPAFLAPTLIHRDRLLFRLVTEDDPDYEEFESGCRKMRTARRSGC